ncbi:MAG: Mu transposase C-terminal domain-containing protein [Chloroflexota bacterium]|nr:Mu transposase C-terminal domain-containing protein [Chloroflexota bacterium]
MQATIQAESSSVEFLFLLWMDFVDESTLEFYDQPQRIKLRGLDKNQKERAWLHTPDYFRIGTDWIGYVECKPGASIQQLAKDKPWNYHLDAEGRWHYLPGERYAEQLGLSYRVWTPDEASYRLHNNVMLLADYMRAESESLPIDESIARRVMQLLDKEHGLTLAALLEGAGAEDEVKQLSQLAQRGLTDRSAQGALGTPDATVTEGGVGRAERLSRTSTSTSGARDVVGRVADTVYSLIVSHRLYVDLSAESLTNAFAVRVFRDRESARAYTIRTETPTSTLPVSALNLLNLTSGAKVTYEDQEFTLLHVGERATALIASGGAHDSDSHPHATRDAIASGAHLGFIELTNEVFDKLVKDGKIKGAETAARPLSEEVLELRSRVTTHDEAEANRRFWRIAPRLFRHIDGSDSAPPDDTNGTYAPGAPAAQRDLRGVGTLPAAPPSELGPVTPANNATYLPGAAPSRRTLQRWVGRYRQAESAHGCGYDGVLPRHHRKGNRKPKLPDESMELMLKYIVEEYESGKQSPVREVYVKYRNKSDERGIVAASYNTFASYVRERPRYQQILKRQGSRAAHNSEARFYWYLDRATPPHGEHAFSIVHIDHTQSDLELVDPETGENLGRPWLSFAIDARTRRILALHVSYDAPSTVTCMLLMREIVRRGGRAPQIVIVDGGKEFSSIGFETLLARLICGKKERKGKPRKGNVIERVFGTTNTEFIHNLQGNTQAMRNARQVTKHMNPKALAVWHLEALHYNLQVFCYEVYDNMVHPALGCTPREAMMHDFSQRGARRHQRVVFDDNFVKLTMPSTPKGTARVQENGIKFHNLYYSCPTLHEPGVLHSSVPVRYDPLDLGSIWAYVKGWWVECYCEHRVTFQGRSEKEIRLLTEALREKQRQQNRAVHVNGKALAEFLDGVEAQEVVLVQQKRDQETRRVRANIDNPAASAATREEDDSTAVSTIVEASGSEASPEGAPPNHSVAAIAAERQEGRGPAAARGRQNETHSKAVATEAAAAPSNVGSLFTQRAFRVRKDFV